MINRQIREEAESIGKQLPVVALIGPRQSGKTTLAKLVFPNHTYVSLEDLDKRRAALDDPRGFLNANKNQHGLIIDEVQHVPDLLSYIQTYVDESEKPGEFVLTGSQNLLVNEKITQSLAGRVGILTLLPLSITELKEASKLSENVNEVMYQGFYPRIHARNIEPRVLYPGYIQTYVERDVRSLKAIENLSEFQKFMKLCAGRCGQVLNIVNLSNDCGVSANTVKAWLSILEATYIIFLLYPHHKNYRKRLIKSPKLYFYDVGLAAHLLDIQSPKDIANHYLRGGLFESMVIADLYKQSYNRGRRPYLYFWRDHTGNEIDCIIEKGLEPTPLEIKATETLSSSHFDGLTKWSKLADFDQQNAYLVYGGDQTQSWKKGKEVSWRDLDVISF